MLTGTFSKLMPSQSPTPQVAVNDLFRQGWQQVVQTTDGDPGLRATVARPFGVMLVDVGEYAAGRDALGTARQYLLANGESSSVEYLQIVFKLAYAQFMLGNVPEAKARYNEVIQRAGSADEQAKAAISARTWLGEMARREGELQLAKAESSRAVAAAKARFGESSDVYRLSQEMLGRINDDLGEWRAGEAAAANQTDAKDPEAELTRRGNDATRAIMRGEYAKAAAELQVLAPAMRERLGTVHPSTILAHGWLSGALLKEGRFEEAEVAVTQALQWSRQASQPDLQPNMEVAMARYLLLANRLEQAEPLLRSVQAYVAKSPTMRPFRPRIRRMQAELLLRRNRAKEALELLRVAHDEQLRLNQGPTTDTPYSLASQGVAMDIAHGIAGAIPLYEQSTQLARKLLPEGHPDISKMQLLLDYARWRAEPAESATRALNTSAVLYADARRTRIDAAEVRALTQRLTHASDAASLRTNLLRLMDY
jgi:tetratricopeptide (TPR) repeat protein